jgi:transposase
MSQTLNAAVAVVGIDIGKNSFHIVGHDERGAIVLRQKWSRGQVEARFANLPPCLIGIRDLAGRYFGKEIGWHFVTCKRCSQLCTRHAALFRPSDTRRSARLRRKC